MLDWGLKISQEGFDVKTCDDKDLVMSSKFDMLKTAATGTTTPVSPINHGLSYLPIFFTINTITVSGKAGFIGDDTSYIDATKLQVSAPAGPTRYYIFYHEF